MKIHGFICNWKGHELNAIHLAEKLKPLIDVTVISTDPGIREKHSDWIHLDESAYFSEQWNLAVRLFTGDIFFQIQADAFFDDFPNLFQKAKATFSEGSIGVYEPNIDLTAYDYDLSKLSGYKENIFEVPLTDTICWFISADILVQLPPVDLAINKYGWGVCAAIAAISHLNKKLCVRDYDFTVRHEPGRGYSTEAALKERGRYLRSLPTNIAQEMKWIYRSPLLPKRPRAGL
ncbi:hypothetical protein L0222_30775 [bacterium]|nr:hypothetical protein [bacterium]MCI0603020.1 hypothetical protein [bacterium]